MDSTMLFDRDNDSRQGRNDLIAADRVRGTEVYNRAGEKLGSIDSILIDKVSGQVAYVVMSFGGFLGIGEKFHPLPWDVLDYDTNVGGYHVDLDRSQLEGAPSYGRDEVDSFDYGSNSGTIDDYYGQQGVRGQQGVGDRGGRSPDYDNGTTVHDESRSELQHGHAHGGPPPKGFYSPEAQSERSSGEGAKTSDHEDAVTTDGGFYSPEQQAIRNRGEDDGTGAFDPTTDSREPISGVPGSTNSWDGPDRR